MALFANGQNVSGGGSGSGGHTIQDNSGTDLTQRDTMQFIGAYSEDDTTNGKTLVSVMRTMSGIEFSQLSEAEKQGIIFVDDETTGTVYEVITSVDMSDMDMVFLDNTIAHNQAGSRFINDTRTDLTAFGYVSIRKNNNDIYLAINTDTYTEFYYIIRYTKTTDTAGSGQWTPQGVPTVDYSTDERVVGTWIDGSTIYEKTFDVSSSPIDLSPNTWVDTPFSATNITRIIDFSALSSDGSNIGWLGVSRNGNYIRLQNVRNSSIPIAIFTIQYTKASS